MWKEFGSAAFEFEKNKYAFNTHHLSIRPETFRTDRGLSSFWNVNAVSESPDNITFVSGIESKRYPIMGTQFHPEEPSQQWTDGLNINHSWESIELQEMFSRELVMMARRNGNTFGNYTEYAPYDISNYNVIDTGSDH
jgi:gamma-glutamyl hydrolase